MFYVYLSILKINHNNIFDANNIFYNCKQMNKNIGTSNGDNIQTHPPNKNNINIQINFNMKDKLPGFVGKKIDNYVEIQQKRPVKKQTNVKNSESGKKIKKKGKQTIEKQAKAKNTNNSTDPKVFERTKNVKNNSNQKTPERRSNSRKDERSKSTNNKPMTRKNAKSMQNIKVKYMKNKERSPVSSQQKQRSHSKSSKKLIKSQKQSLKSLYTFANTTLKNKMNKSKISNSRQRQISSANKNREENHDKIKNYMEERKKKEKVQRGRLMKEEKIKKQKIANQLKKVEIQRKANASKSFVGLKKNNEEKEQRFPMYFMDDEDEFEQQNSYNKLKKQAEQIIHNSPPASNYIEAIPFKKITFSDKYENQNCKKQKKLTKVSLVHKYLNGTITSKQLEELTKNIIKIQSIWRGYNSRKTIFARLRDESTRIRYIKNKIDNKRGTFWNEEQNSIIKIQKDSNIQVYDSGHSSSNIINFNSNINSIVSNTSSNVVSVISGLKPSNDKFKRLSIQLEDGIIQNFQSDKQKNKKQQNNQKMLKELQELKKQLEKQNEKFRSLETENLNLKQNIKFLSLKESREIIVDNSQDNFNSTEYIEIRMPKKIESPPHKKQQNIKLQPFQKSNESESTKQFLSNEKESVGLNSFKKQFESFECSSPSNARMEQQLKVLKNKNIEGIFKKKQLKIEQKYEKKAEIFDKMLNDKLFSPRTFAVKKKQLQSKLEQQKDQIKVRIQEAKRVVGYIEDISQSQQHEQEQKLHDLNQCKTNFRIIEDPAKLNYKNQHNVIDSFTNTSPLEQKPIQFTSNKKKPDPVINVQNNSYSQSSEEEKIYKKYWADDIQDVIRQSNEIKKKVDEAIRAQRQSSSDSKKQNNLSSQKQKQTDLQQQRQNTQGTVNLKTLKKSFQEVLQQPTEIEKKAQQIFNKINLNEENQCKSQQQDGPNHHDISDIKNHLQNNDFPHVQNKKVQNLYISEVEFNKQKRKQEELSRSSSFDKSNKSLSMSNSQVQTKGFISNLTFIKQFCISICQFIRNHPQYKQNFVFHVSETIKFDFQEYLKSYRTTINGEIKNNYNTFQEQYMYPYFKIITNKVQPLTKELFTDFTKYYDQEKIDNPSWNGPTLTKKIKQMRQIFMISIIDAFNESLEYERPGSIHGEPLPWLQHQNTLKNFKNSKLKLLMVQKYSSYDSDKIDEYPDEQMKLDQIFGSSIAKIIQWGSCLCGFIADPNSMEMGDSGIANLSDSQLNSIRENRVGLMLQKWLLQEEQKITNSTAEYTQVLLALGEKVMDILMLQWAQELSELQFADISYD